MNCKHTLQPGGVSLTVFMTAGQPVCPWCENDRLRAALRRIADDDVPDDLKECPEVLSGIAWAALDGKTGEQATVELDAQIDAELAKRGRHD